MLGTRLHVRKAMINDDFESARKISFTTNPSEIKQLGSAVNVRNTDNWNAVKGNLMLELVRAKYEHNDNLKHTGRNWERLVLFNWPSTNPSRCLRTVSNHGGLIIYVNDDFSFSEIERNQSLVHETLGILRIHRRHTKVHNYPQSNSVRHFSTQTNNIKTWL